MPSPSQSYNMAQLFGHNLSPPAPVPTVEFNYRDPLLLTGVEVEAERTSVLVRRFENLNNSFWRIASDGSLRNGAEFVLSEPLCGNMLATAIRQFFTTSDGAETRANARTSCHIHVEMRDATLPQLCGTILAYQAAELGFWNATHAQRRWTGYCLPLMEAQGSVVAELMSPQIEPLNVVDIIRSANRYCAFNLAALARHGSVEFRHFYNPSDEAQLNKWINLCHAIKLLGYKIAETASASDNIFSWASGNVETIVDWVIQDVSLGEFVTADKRDASIESVEKLLGIVEAARLNAPRAPRRSNNTVMRDTPYPEDVVATTPPAYRASTQTVREPTYVYTNPSVFTRRPGHIRVIGGQASYLDLDTPTQAAVVNAWDQIIYPLFNEYGISNRESIRNRLFLSENWPSSSCNNAVIESVFRECGAFVDREVIEAIARLKYAVRQGYACANVADLEDNEEYILSEIKAAYNTVTAYVNNRLESAAAAGSESTTVRFTLRNGVTSDTYTRFLHALDTRAATSPPAPVAADRITGSHWTPVTSSFDPGTTMDAEEFRF